MPNYNVKKQLERIARELRLLREYVQTSGVSATQSRLIDNMADDIAQDVSRIANVARAAARKG